MLQEMTNRLIEVRRNYGMKINGKETDIMKVSRPSSRKQIIIDQKQPENVEYFNYFGILITNKATYTREIKSGVATKKSAYKTKKIVFPRKLGFNLNMKCAPAPIIQEAGWYPGPCWTGAENLAPTGIRSPDRPANSLSLHRLLFPGSLQRKVCFD